MMASRLLGGDYHDNHYDYALGIVFREVFQLTIFKVEVVYGFAIVVVWRQNGVTAARCFGANRLTSKLSGCGLFEMTSGKSFDHPHKQQNTVSKTD